LILEDKKKINRFLEDGTIWIDGLCSPFEMKEWADHLLDRYSEVFKHGNNWLEATTEIQLDERGLRALGYRLKICCHQEDRDIISELIEKFRKDPFIIRRGHIFSLEDHEKLRDGILKLYYGFRPRP